MENLSLGKKVNFFVTAATSATILCAALYPQMPTQNYHLNLDLIPKYSYERFLEDNPYSITSIDRGLLQKAEIILNFTKKILANSNDLDPSISKLINENFWDLE